MHWSDARLQSFRSLDAPASAFRWVPVRWMNPQLYVIDGQRYRKRAIRYWWLSIAFFAAGMLGALLRV
jgi:hypothetical protein